MPRYDHSKIGGMPKTPKFEKPPLGVLEQKNFGFPSFSIGGTFTPKMIKIGSQNRPIFRRIRKPPPLFPPILKQGGGFLMWNTPDGNKCGIGGAPCPEF